MTGSRADSVKTFLLNLNSFVKLYFLQVFDRTSKYNASADVWGDEDMLSRHTKKVEAQNAINRAIKKEQEKDEIKAEKEALSKPFNLIRARDPLDPLYGSLNYPPYPTAAPPSPSSSPPMVLFDSTVKNISSQDINDILDTTAIKKILLLSLR